MPLDISFWTPELKTKRFNIIKTCSSEFSLTNTMIKGRAL